MRQQAADNVSVAAKKAGRSAPHYLFGLCITNPASATLFATQRNTRLGARALAQKSPAWICPKHMHQASPGSAVVFCARVCRTPNSCWRNSVIPIHCTAILQSEPTPNSSVFCTYRYPSVAAPEQDHRGLGFHTTNSQSHLPVSHSHASAHRPKLQDSSDADT